VDKTNEIPVARALFERLDVEGRLVGLDALHTQAETARALVQEAGADYMLTLKDNQKGIRANRALPSSPPQRRLFSPSADHIHDGVDRREELQPSRTPPDSHPCWRPLSRSASLTFEQIAPTVSTHRQTQTRDVWLLTSLTPDRLNAAQWLQANRAYWGIEGGLHQRLDASTNEDQCRVRDRNGVWVFGIFRRLAVSLFAEWRSRDTKRRHATMTDFQSEMGAEHASYACVSSQHVTHVPPFRNVRE